MPNAIDLLDADHRKVEQMFQQYQAESDRGRKEQLARSICTELTVHTQIEDEIFYPAFRQQARDQDLLKDALHEHDEARQVISQLETQGVQDALVSKLQKMIDHHVQDEREKMFPEARSAGMDLDGLGRQLEQRKQELMEHPTTI